MIGREVIVTEKAYDLDDLYNLFTRYWDYENYNVFEIGRPTPASIEEYICIPATDHFMIIVYGRKAGKFFSKKNKVILTVCETPSGMAERFREIRLRNHGVLNDITRDLEEERTGLAQDLLIQYTEFVADILLKDVEE